MHFRKIRIESFGSHVDTMLDLAPLTFIRGANGVGKSQLGGAIEMTLTGRTDATTADGKGCSGLIRAEASKALITLAAVQDDGSERILKCALNASSKPAVIVARPDDPQYSGGSDYLEYLAINREVLSCLTNNRFFVDRPEKEQRDILARIVLPKTYVWPDWVMPAANDLALKINWAKTPFEVIDQAYDAAFAERTNVNRDIKNFRLPEGDTAEAANLADYTERLAVRKSELDGLKAKRAQIEADARNEKNLLRLAEEKLATATAKLSREEQDARQIEAGILAPGKLKEAEKLAKRAKEAADLDAKIAGYDAQIATLTESMRKLSALEEMVGAACPTCGSAVTVESIQAIAVSVTRDKNTALDNRRDALDQRKAIGDPATAKAALDAHSRATADLERSKARIRDEHTAIQDAEGRIAELKAQPAPATCTVLIDEQITETAGMVTTGEQAVATARTAKDIADRIAKAKLERDALYARQSQLERMVEYFGAKGVKADLLAVSIGTFQDSMNTVLGEWGYTCELSIEPFVFAIDFVTRSGHALIPLKNLSKSQRYRFATAFQVALAITTGFKFVIVDEADIFDADGRAGLFAALTSGQLEQAIILATDERLDAPEIPDAVFYAFENIAAPGEVPTTRAHRLMPAVEKAA